MKSRFSTSILASICLFMGVYAQDKYLVSVNDNVSGTLQAIEFRNHDGSFAFDTLFADFADTLERTDTGYLIHRRSTTLKTSGLLASYSIIESKLWKHHSKNMRGKDKYLKFDYSAGLLNFQGNEVWSYSIENDIPESGSTKIYGLGQVKFSGRKDIAYFLSFSSDTSDTGSYTIIDSNGQERLHISQMNSHPVEVPFRPKCSADGRFACIENFRKNDKGKSIQDLVILDTETFEMYTWKKPIDMLRFCGPNTIEIDPVGVGLKKKVNLRELFSL